MDPITKGGHENYKKEKTALLKKGFDKWKQRNDSKKKM